MLDVSVRWEYVALVEFLLQQVKWKEADLRAALKCCKNKEISFALKKALRKEQGSRSGGWSLFKCGS